MASVGLLNLANPAPLPEAPRGAPAVDVTNEERVERFEMVVGMEDGQAVVVGGSETKHEMLEELETVRISVDPAFPRPFRYLLDDEGDEGYWYPATSKNSVPALRSTVHDEQSKAGLVGSVDEGSGTANVS